jgi:hypothetical protein
MGCNSSSVVEDKLPYVAEYHIPQVYVLPRKNDILSWNGFMITYKPRGCKKCGCYSYSFSRHDDVSFVYQCNHYLNDHSNNCFDRADAYRSHIVVDCKQCGCKKLSGSIQSIKTPLKTDDYCSCGHTYDEHFTRC